MADMQLRLAEILVHVIDRLLENPQALDDYDGMVESLLARGIGPAEARQALGWLMTALRREQLDDERGGEGRTAGGVHVLDRSDQDVLSLEAQGLLIELRELGVLDDFQVEQAVERALYRGGGPVTRDEMRAAVADLLLEEAGAATSPVPHWSALDGDEEVIH